MVSQIPVCSITKIDEDYNMINLAFKACYHLWPGNPVFKSHARVEVICKNKGKLASCRRSHQIV